MKSEIRKDYVQDKYVIIAPERAKRTGVNKNQKKFAIKICPFCPKNIARAKSILDYPSKKSWEIKVVPNKYPAISLDNPSAYGIQEVLIESRDHLKELEDLSVGHISKLLEIYAIRTREISKNKKIQYILIFKNSGGPAGASLIHSHSQIFATDFIPPQVLDKSRKTHEYTIKTGKCPYCEVIKKESRGPRLVYKDKHIIAFCPYAPMHNYEIWLMPLRHIDNITGLNNKERLSFAKILKKILKKIEKLNLPYNYYFHQVIPDENQHLYLKIIPRGSLWAGVEIGSGIIINPISPEKAARFYRSK